MRGFEGDQVVAVAEKQPISRHATVGIYYFRRGLDFVQAAERMLLKHASVGGEFYVAPVFNEFILDGQARRPLPDRRRPRCTVSALPKKSNVFRRVPTSPPPTPHAEHRPAHRWPRQPLRGCRIRTAETAHPVHGVPMIETVVRNVRPAGRAPVHLRRPRRSPAAPGHARDARARRARLRHRPVDRVTRGRRARCSWPASTSTPNDPLMLANSDQWVGRRHQRLPRPRWIGSRPDGLIMTMKADDPKWSFVGLRPAGLVTAVVEKQVISDEAYGRHLQLPARIGLRPRRRSG
jgi:hypothetical protein